MEALVVVDPHVVGDDPGLGGQGRRHVSGGILTEEGVCAASPRELLLVDALHGGLDRGSKGFLD